MKRWTILMGVVLVLVAITIPGYGEDRGVKGSLAGTWYGGSAYKYLLTIIPVDEDRYTVIYNPGYPWTLDYVEDPTKPFTQETQYTGTLVKKHDPGNPRAVYYEGTAISLGTTEHSLYPPPAGVMLALHEKGKLVNSNTLQFEIDFFGVYNWTANSWQPGEKVPFKDPLDIDFLNGATIVETYHRISASCPACE